MWELGWKRDEMKQVGTTFLENAYKGGWGHNRRNKPYFIKIGLRSRNETIEGLI